MQKLRFSFGRNFILKLLVACSIAFTFLGSSAEASTQVAPSMSVRAGFDGRFVPENWIPVEVSLKNEGSDFQGRVSVQFPSSFQSSNLDSSYTTDVELASGAQKQVSLLIPLTAVIAQSLDLKVALIDQNNQEITSQKLSLRPTNMGDLLIGQLTDHTSGFGAFNQMPLPIQNATFYLYQFQGSNFPTQPEVLNNFQILMIDSFATSSLSQEQIQSLSQWVHQGGELWLIGGPEGKRSLTGLPASLLPVTINGTTTLSPQTSLFSPGSAPKNGQDSLDISIPISTSTLNTGSTLLHGTSETPLLAQKTVDKGEVYYLAFDPALAPLSTWSGSSALWGNLLMRSIGEQWLSTVPDTTKNGNIGPGFDGNVTPENLVQNLFPTTIPSIWLIMVLIIGYLIILGPVRLIIIRVLKKRQWSWRIVLSTIVVFSLLSYGLALQQKGTALLSNRITVLDLNSSQDATSNGVVSNYYGIFVPNEGDYHLQLPGNNHLIQSSKSNDGSPYSPSQTNPTTVTNNAQNTDIAFEKVNVWTTRSISEHHQLQVQGGLVSQLSHKESNIVGFVKNTLPYTISDAYVLVQEQAIPLGNIASGESKQIDVPIEYYPPTPPQPYSPNQSKILQNLAQIWHLTENDIQTSYYNGSLTGATTDNINLRHYAILNSILTQPSCNTCNSKQWQGGQAVVGGAPNSLLSYGRDPFLPKNIDVQLIGWLNDNPDLGNNAQINGSSHNTSVDTLLRAPLNFSYQGNVIIPPQVITGRLLDLQTNQTNPVQTNTPGLYNISNGSATFEYTLPNLGGTLQTSRLFLTSPGQFVFNINTNTPNDLADMSTSQTTLYNWQTQKWDTITFNASVAQVKDAQPYMNANGQLLVHIDHSSTSQQDAYFGQLALEVQGVIR